MPTLTQCFSALAASGQGQKCNDFRERIRERFLEIDSLTGEKKSFLYKYGQEKYPEVHKKLRVEMAEIVSTLLNDVDDLHIFGPDLELKNVQQK